MENDLHNIKIVDSLVISNTLDIEFSEQVLEKISEATKAAICVADDYWNAQKVNLSNNLSENKKALETKKAIHDKVYLSLHDKISENKAVIALSEKIREESGKLEKYRNLDSSAKLYLEKYNRILIDVTKSIGFYNEQHKKFADSVNQNENLSKSDLDFSVRYTFRIDAFGEKIRQLADKRKLKTIIDMDNFIDSQYNDETIKTIITSILDNKLTLLKGVTSESALRDILSDWYNTTYSVSMDGDSIDVMSPGKKALVLLKLLISLANSKCPILIDQPEDDLDNRSIFDDLIPFIKEKKKDRQIIVVTHNANIVLGGDSEEIIVANQSGKNSPNNTYRFEYRSGSIENDHAIFDEDGSIKKGILNGQGIQQHICDILEGGEKAFDLRKSKYHI